MGVRQQYATNLLVCSRHLNSSKRLGCPRPNCKASRLPIGSFRRTSVSEATTKRVLTIAMASRAPRRRQWGVVTAENFLHVLEDVTTWSLTHLETVRSWSSAEDLTPDRRQLKLPELVIDARQTPIEIAVGFKLVGRNRRMVPADYPGDRAARSLVDIEDPAVRGSALWFAHSVMASFHQDASDRQTAYRRTSRQELKYAASPPAAGAWLASRMRTWPDRYRSKCWLNPQS
jgi:hypothetical protein